MSIAVPGKFQTAYRSACYLEANGQFERLVTMLPYARSRDFGVSAEKTHAAGSDYGRDLLEGVFRPQLGLKAREAVK